MFRIGRAIASITSAFVCVAGLATCSEAGTALRLTEIGTSFNGIALGHSGAGLLKGQLLPRLTALLGAPRQSTGHICPHGSLRVEVDRWGDLSVVFAGGEFIELDFNQGGWSSALKPHPPLPPSGATLRPLVQTTSGIMIGTTLARARTLDPGLRGTVNSVFVRGHLELSMTRTSTVGWVVSQISSRYGNPC